MRGTQESDHCMNFIRTVPQAAAEHHTATQIRLLEQPCMSSPSADEELTLVKFLRPHNK